MATHPGMRFSVDPWDPSYGVSLDTADGQSRQQVDVDVELPPDEWRPLDAAPGTAVPSAVLFVDGVRRVDAQVWVDDDSDDTGAVPAPPTRRAWSAAARTTGRTWPPPRCGARSSPPRSTPWTSSPAPGATPRT